jgi:hypothetical protein
MGAGVSTRNDVVLRTPPRRGGSQFRGRGARTDVVVVQPAKGGVYVERESPPCKVEEAEDTLGTLPSPKWLSGTTAVDDTSPSSLGRWSPHSTARPSL